jgi:two-component system OmpR family response regulator
VGTACCGAMESDAASSKVLVVDDEHSIVDAVATALRYEGFEVTEAMTGREALASAQETVFDLIVLDVMLPDFDGYEVAGRLRADGVGTPILFLTARTGLEDKATAFGLGADDFVTKPFSLAEIVMRVHAILRRSRAASGVGSSDDELRFADLVMDTAAHRVWRGGVEVQLTATEFRLLRMFLMNPGRVLSKAQILDHVWHYDFDGDSNILETYISYLRRKLNELGPPLIHTVRLVGYVLREDGDA